MVSLVLPRVQDVQQIILVLWSWMVLNLGCRLRELLLSFWK